MRRLLGCLALSFCSASFAHAQVVTLKVMTYNVQKTTNYAEIAEVIYAEGATIVAIQETDTTKAEGIRNAIQNRTPEADTWHVTTAQGIPGSILPAVVSKYPILATTHINLYSQGDFYGEYRQAVQATLEVSDFAGGPRRLQVISTHFSTRESGEQPRRRQAEELVAFAKPFPGPRILLGDFNFDPERDSPGTDPTPYNTVRNAGYQDAFRELHPSATTDPGRTIATRKVPTAYLTRRFDYAFYTRTAGFYAVTSAVVMNARTDFASDHYPLLTEFEWDGSTTGDPGTTGSIAREYWTGIPGSAVSAITGPPTGSHALTWYLEGVDWNAPPAHRPRMPYDWADNYGQRIRGYITAPQTGAYTFWLASDDNSELWLNASGQDPAGAARIAHISGTQFTHSAQWWKQEVSPHADLQQRSAPVSLAAGQQYYIEVLHKEGTGGDAVAVGWQLPNGDYERPIPAWRLSPFTGGAPNNNPAISSASANPSQANVNQNVSFTASASDPDGDPIAYSWNFGDGTAPAPGQNVTHAYASANTYNAVVTVTDNRGGSATRTVTVVVTSPGGGGVLLEDNFNDNSLELTTKWERDHLFSGATNTAVPVAETNQRLEIGPLLTNSTSAYNGIRSLTTHDFTGAYVYVQLVQPAASASTGFAMLTIGPNGTNHYRFYTVSGQLVCEKKIANQKSWPCPGGEAGIPLTANHQFLSIRHEGTDVVWATAPAAGSAPGTWTDLYRETWNSSVTLTGMIFELKAGTSAVQSTPPGTVFFDNFRAARRP